jgi:hypothetical protein
VSACIACALAAAVMSAGNAADGEQARLARA